MANLIFLSCNMRKWYLYANSKDLDKLVQLKISVRASLSIYMYTTVSNEFKSGQ